MMETMKSLNPPSPLSVPVDDEHARMMEYAFSRECQAIIATAQTEIDAGKGIVADNAYFQGMKARRARQRAARS